MDRTLLLSGGVLQYYSFAVVCSIRYKIKMAFEGYIIDKEFIAVCVSNINLNLYNLSNNRYLLCTKKFIS